MNNQNYVIAVFKSEDAAHGAVEKVIAADCPMDKLSVLGRLSAEGDDVLGLVHPGVGKRMEVWGANGAVWGGIAGLLAGAAGVLWLPVLGPVIAVGHILSSVAGGAVGAAVGGTGLAGAAAISQLAVILHRHGLPDSVLQQLHDEIAAGRFIVIAQAGDADEAGRYRDALGGAERVVALP